MRSTNLCVIASDDEECGHFDQRLLVVSGLLILLVLVIFGLQLKILHWMQGKVTVVVEGAGPVG